MVFRLCFPKKAKLWMSRYFGRLILFLIFAYAVIFYVSVLILVYQYPSFLIPAAHRIVILSDKDALLYPAIRKSNENNRSMPNSK